MRQQVLAIIIGKNILHYKETHKQSLELKDFKSSEQALGAIMASENILEVIGYNQQMIRNLLEEIINGKHN